MSTSPTTPAFVMLSGGASIPELILKTMPYNINPQFKVDAVYFDEHGIVLKHQEADAKGSKYNIHCANNSVPSKAQISSVSAIIDKAQLTDTISNPFQLMPIKFLGELSPIAHACGGGVSKKR